MMVTGGAAAAGIAVVRCKKYGITRLDAVLIACMALAGGVGGAILFKPVIRLPDIIIHRDFYAKVPLGDFFSWYFGELVFYGGLIGGTVAAVLFCRHFGISVSKTADLTAPAIPIGHAFGRLGCFFGGCCYGIEVSVSNPFAIVYPDRTDGLAGVSAPAGKPLLAVPLIEAAGNVMIACLILLFERKNNTPGRGLALYGILYSVQRFVLEFFRGDLVRGVYGGISTSQIISIIILALSVFYVAFAPYIIKKRQAR